MFVGNIDCFPRQTGAESHLIRWAVSVVDRNEVLGRRETDRLSTREGGDGLIQFDWHDWLPSFRCQSLLWFGQAAGILLLLANFATNRCAAGEVLIYYANETRPEGLEQENYDTFATWLREIDTEESRKIARGLISDAALFPAAVDEETAQLVSFAGSMSDDQAIVVFTNQLARQNRCLRIQSGSQPREVDFVVPKLDSLVLDGNPLSRRAVFQSALQRVSELFIPKDHRYVLITKSHGSSQLALTVRLQQDFREFSKEKLESSLDDPNPNLSPNLGIKKQEYFDVLKTAGNEFGMKFSLVFVESCRRTIDTSTLENFPDCIDRFFASGDRYLTYQTLDYSEVLTRVETGSPFGVALGEQLEGKYLGITRNPSQKYYWALLCFTAAFAFLFFSVRHRIASSKQENVEARDTGPG